MFEDKKNLEKCSPRQQDMCREHHVHASINALTTLTTKVGLFSTSTPSN